MEDVADALQDAQRALCAAEVATRSGLGTSDLDQISSEKLQANPVKNVRSDVDGALDRLERARHTVMIAIFAAALADGVSISELARSYGFSRQRAAKLAQEARQLQRVP